jgi:hypothetical protein
MIKTICMVLFFLEIFQIGLSKNIVCFNVDMNQPIKTGIFHPVSGDMVILCGSFNNWQGNDFILKDENGDYVYTGIFNLKGDSGKVVEYKYVILKNDGAILWEGMANLGNPPYGNRMFLLTGKEQNFQTVEYRINRYHLYLAGKKVEFTIQELQDDFNQLRYTLENHHCCLYEYTAKEAFNTLFHRQYNLIDRSMQPHEFYKILTPLTSNLGCMHTAIWMPDDFWQMDTGNLFPLKIKLIEDYVVVAGSYNDPIQLPLGSIILAINNRPVNEIIEEMKANYSADAFNIYFIISQIEKRFSMIYASRFGFPEKYFVTFASPGSSTRQTREVIPADIQSVKKDVFKNFTNPELTFRLLEGKTVIAIMTINSFIYYDRVSFFKNFIDSCFNVIDEKNIKNLILDLRGNDGGDPFCAVHLFSYLEQEPFPYFAEPYGKYAKFASPIPPAEKQFTGNLYTLLDGRCASTNGHFCSLLKYHKIGKFIGTPSGASYKCNAGKDTEICLDNTGFLLNFGRETFAAAVKGMDKTKPIMPDFYITQSYRDFLDGRDLFIETALKLINELQ